MTKDKTSDTPAHVGSDPSDPVSAEEVRSELNRILASAEFKSSKRCQEFLVYVVETTLSGRADTLKERTIATEVLGKPASYEPSEDASVRVRAGEVRRRLEQYYGRAATEAQVVVDLPSGRYVPEFRHPRKEDALKGAPNRGGRRRARLLRILAGASLVLAAVVFLRIRANVSALDRFWSPVFQGDAPISLCASAVPAYVRTEARSETAACGGFTFTPSQLVSVVDLEAVSQIGEMLTRTRRPYRLRFGDAVSFRELLSGPAILVGYSYSAMPEISKSVRFYIGPFSDHKLYGIFDKGTPTSWAVDPNDSALAEDYALVSRFVDPKTHNMVVEVAGITHFGTEAAARFVTDHRHIEDVFRRSPAEWERKNLQLVLRVQVIQGTSTVTAVLATHYW